MTAKPSATVPRPGLVIRYAYLWRSEARAGQQEGKDRPCAVVVTTTRENDRTTVYVAPITHSPPHEQHHAIELPAETKRRLGLDDERSWIIATELNRFTWPGPDVRPVGRAGDERGFAYGLLPRNMTADLIERVREHVRRGQARAVERDEASRHGED